MKSEREQLAEYAHDAWSGWMKYLFSKCEVCVDGSLKIPEGLENRWRRQIRTPYVDLPENEKESDRAEADKITTITVGIIQQAARSYRDESPYSDYVDGTEAEETV